MENIQKSVLLTFWCSDLALKFPNCAHMGFFDSSTYNIAKCGVRYRGPGTVIELLPELKLQDKWSNAAALSSRMKLQMMKPRAALTPE